MKQDFLARVIYNFCHEGSKALKFHHLSPAMIHNLVSLICLMKPVA